MNSFRSVPIDIMLINDNSAVDLFILKDEKLVVYLQKNEMLTSEHFEELKAWGLRKLFIRSSEAQTFEAYLQSNSQNILTNPTVPSKVKAATFYVSSIYLFQHAFERPDSEKIENVKNVIKPLLKGIMRSEILLSDILSITEYDFTTYIHCVNVGIYATCLALDFFKNDPNVGQESLERQSYGYFLHDIGKSKVPLEIINKRGKLDQEEWTCIKKHPEWGYAILMETGNLTDEAAYISMQHHERPDGSGYPRGTTDIHPCARICTMADIYDALTSIRPYKDAISPFEALSKLKDEALTAFDRDLLNRLIALLGPGPQQ